MSGPFLPPIILSQTEIETVGLQPGGRLRLLDGFLLGDQRVIAAAESDAIATVRSMTAEADAIRKDIEQLNAQLAQLPSIEEQLAQLAPHEQQLAALSADAQAKTGQLNILSGTISLKGVASAAVQRFEAAVANWRATLTRVQTMAGAEGWPVNAGADPLGDARTRVAKAHQYIAAALQELAAVEAATGQIASALDSEKIGYEDQARALRRDIEGLQTGAGNIARQGQALRERKAQLESLRGVLATRVAAMQSAAARRSAALDAGFLAAMRKSGVRAVEDMSHMHGNPMDSVPDDVLLAWCEADAAIRYPVAAATITLFRRPEEKTPRQWTPAARLVLEKAPDPVYRSWPNFYGGFGHERGRARALRSSRRTRVCWMSWILAVIPP
ncbi:hypothetical protein LB542_05885 [Mesorhizobium sp. BR1-1-9]|uniref:hypothetical protein n=1 Tax=Mesorhizobium sp. BR1-1-9 TaxID=2876646 RepID=UPI001CD0AA35|nr:hypothetical protein [Mesorhizobium sp. BR1-1-9]MBZ9870386.1 hypothetical protein [Mesorhizobium sp. BR1-1-9]